MDSNHSHSHIEQERPLQEQLTQVRNQQEELEHRLEMLENTLQAVATQDGNSIGGECQECNQCLLVIQNGVMDCPKCGHQRPF